MNIIRTDMVIYVVDEQNHALKNIKNIKYC